MKTVANTSAPLLAKKGWKYQILKYKYIYILLLPAILHIIVFQYVPMYGFILAFKEFNPGLGIWKSPWVGFDNFKKLFEDPQFYTSLKNSLIISAMKIYVGLPIPITFALLLKELKSKTYSKFVQTVSTFPHFLSWVVVSGIIINLFSTDGAINAILNALGLPATNLLTNPKTFRWFLFFTDVWKETGWGSIIYIAALTGIDQSFYEAATIDGANRWQKIRYISLPALFPLITVSLIMSFTGLLGSSFEQIFNLYNSSLRDVAETLGVYIYRLNFQQIPSYGFSMAVEVFNQGIAAILLILGNYVSKWLGGKGLFEGGIRENA